MVSGRAFQTNVHVHRPGCCPSGLKGLLGLEFGPSEVDRAFRWVRRATVLPRDLSVCVVQGEGRGCACLHDPVPSSQPRDSQATELSQQPL